MLLSLLEDIGLSPNEGRIYLALLELGTVQAGSIIQYTKISRATVYDGLDRLLTRGLVSKSTKTSIGIYSATNPKYLAFLVENEQERLQQTQERLKKHLPELQSKQNSHAHIPSVRFYEGLEGIRQVLDETFSATETIYAYANIEPIEHAAESIISDYRKKRANSSMHVQGLILRTPAAERIMTDYDPAHVVFRWLPDDTDMFALEMNIYNGKISYMTYRDTNPIAVIIEDADIYRLHRSTFESLWNLSKPI